MKESKKITCLKGDWYKTTEIYYFNAGIYPEEAIKQPLFELSKKGWLKIYPGYTFDGASGCPDFKWIVRASLPHDVLYQMLRMGLLPPEARKSADKLLKRLCIEDGAWHWQASLAYNIVRKLAKSASDKKNRRKTVTFP